MGTGPEGVSINIDFDHTIYINSPEFGADGFGWWMCDAKSDPAPIAVVDDYDPGTYVVSVAVMEYIHPMGESTSTQTVCLTTYSFHNSANPSATVIETCECPATCAA
jgi:hypothetical protein